MADAPSLQGSPDAPSLKSVAWVVIETLPRGPDRWEVAALLAAAGALGPPALHRRSLAALWCSEAEALMPMLSSALDVHEEALQPTGLPGHGASPAALLIARGVAIACHGALPAVGPPTIPLANALGFAMQHMVRARAWHDCVLLALTGAGFTVTPDFLEHAVDVGPAGAGFLCSEAAAVTILRAAPAGAVTLHRHSREEQQWAGHLVPALWCAARAGYPAAAALMLERGATLEDAEWHEGGAARREAVLTAALRGRGTPAAKLDLVRLLLAAGADPGACSAPHEAFLAGDASPLMAAAALGAAEAVKLMLDAGGDPLAALPPFLSEREERQRARGWGFSGQDFREPWRCRSGPPSGASAYTLAAQHRQGEVLELLDAWQAGRCASDEAWAAWVVERAILRVYGELMVEAEAAAAAAAKAKARGKPRRKTKWLVSPREREKALKVWEAGTKEATVGKMLEAAVGAAGARGRGDAALRCPLCRGLREFKAQGLKAHLGSPRHAAFFSVERCEEGEPDAGGELPALPPPAEAS